MCGGGGGDLHDLELVFLSSAFFFLALSHVGVFLWQSSLHFRHFIENTLALLQVPAPNTCYFLVRVLVRKYLWCPCWFYG